jgi:two-component system response regulator MtrA
MSRAILVVEDSPDIIRLVCHILEQAGYEVSAADTGLAGWEAFETKRPDLVLSDVNLPGLSGIELCERIKQVSPSTPVILLTVQAESEAIQRGLQAGANAYLSKPFEITRLIETVEYALKPRIRRLSTLEGKDSGAKSPDH